MTARTLSCEFLCRLEMRVLARYQLGDTPMGGRRVDFLGDGTIVGPRIKAVVSDGVDHMLRLADGTMMPDVKLIARCEDGALLYVTYRGFLHGVREQMDNAWFGREADPEQFTVRTMVNFETGATEYAWLNHTIGIGYGERVSYSDGSRGIRFDIFAVL